MPMIWIVEGVVTDPEAHSKACRIGDPEWQFSNGPAGKRGSSADFLSLEEGLRAHPGCTFMFEPEDDQAFVEIDVTFKMPMSEIVHWWKEHQEASSIEDTCHRLIEHNHWDYTGTPVPFEITATRHPQGEELMLCTEIKPHLLPLTVEEQAYLGVHPLTRAQELEAAMCAWEHLLEAENLDPLDGAAHARYCCGNLSMAIHFGYVIANVNDRLGDYAFDWEFVPWFMDNCIIWDNPHTYIHGTPPLKENWIQLCREAEL